ARSRAGGTSGDPARRCRGCLRDPPPVHCPKVGNVHAMLLVVDVGNTQTHFGTFRGEDLVEHWRFATVRSSTADELGAAFANLLDLRGLSFDDLDASIVSTVVPELEPEYEGMGNRYLGHHTILVGPGLRTGMPIRIDNPRELGADRLVNAIAAYDRFHAACVVVDFGTSIN